MDMETRALAAIRAGERTLDDYGAASISEWLTLCLALGRHDKLAGTGYDAPRAAYLRLDERQRAIVREADPGYVRAVRLGVDPGFAHDALDMDYRLDGPADSYSSDRDWAMRSST